MVLTSNIVLDNGFPGTKCVLLNEGFFISAKLSWRSARMPTEENALNENEFSSAVELLQQSIAGR